MTSSDGLREALGFLNRCRDAMVETGTWENPMPDYWATNALIQEIEGRSIADVAAELRDGR